MDLQVASRFQVQRGVGKRTENWLTRMPRQEMAPMWQTTTAVSLQQCDCEAGLKEKKKNNRWQTVASKKGQFSPSRLCNFCQSDKRDPRMKVEYENKVSLSLFPSQQFSFGFFQVEKSIQHLGDLKSFSRYSGRSFSITDFFFFKSLAMQYVNDSSRQNESCPMLLLHYILLQQLELRQKASKWF